GVGRAGGPGRAPGPEQRRRRDLRTDPVAAQPPAHVHHGCRRRTPGSHRALRRDGRRPGRPEVITMAAPTNIEAMPVVRDLKDFDLNSGNRLERLIFNHRAAVMLACLVVTVVLGYLAVQVNLNASY